MADSANVFGLLPAWSVMFYVGLTSPLLLLRRIQLSLLITFIFTIYWGFLLYWAGVLSGDTPYMAAFVGYTIFALVITMLVVVAYLQKT